MTDIKIATNRGTFNVEIRSEFTKGEQATVCPVCKDTHKSDSGAKDKCGSMNLGKGTYHCNRCGIGGAVVTERGFTSIYEKVKPIRTAFVKSDLTDEWIEWLAKQRRISKDTAMEMNLHVVSKTIKLDIIPEGTKDRDLLLGQYLLVDCLAAFYVYNDQLINVQYRDKWKNFSFESGCDLVFFNADIIAKNKIVVITEGWMDAVAAKEAGLPNVCSVPNGATITPDERKAFERTGSIEVMSEPNLKYLENCWDSFANVDEIVLATDDDAAGQKLMEVLRRRFVNAKKTVSRINFKTLPEIEGKSRKDFNDVLINYGKEAILMLYEKRMKFTSTSIVRLKDVQDDIIRHYEGELPQARKAGWTGMDPFFGWFPGDIIVGNGYPGMGKTTFAMNLMIAQSIRYNTRHLIYSPENMPPSRFFETIMEMYAGKSIDKRDKRSFLTPGGITFSQAMEWTHEFFIIATRRSPLTLPLIRDLAVDENCQGIFIDPWNRLSRDSKHRNNNIDQYIQEELTEQISYGLDTGITTTISVHPPTQDKKNRKYDKTDGGYDHPSAFEAEGGKVWFSSTHVMFCSHRPPFSKETAKQTLIYTQKLKVHKYYGRPTGDKDPLTFEMITSCGRLLLNDQTPLDKQSVTQKSLYEQEYTANLSNPDDEPF